MKPAWTKTMSAVLLMVAGTLMGCGGPPVAVPPASSQVTTPADRSSPGVAEKPPSDAVSADTTPAAAMAAQQQTCDLFRQMVEGVRTLSSRELQALVNEMADAVMGTQNPELMRGVVDMGQGYVASDPQRFARGMRKLSAICNVPYE